MPPPSASNHPYRLTQEAAVSATRWDEHVKITRPEKEFATSHSQPISEINSADLWIKFQKEQVQLSLFFFALPFFAVSVRHVYNGVPRMCCGGQVQASGTASPPQAVEGAWEETFSQELGKRGEEPVEVVLGCVLVKQAGGKWVHGSMGQES